MPVLLDEQLPRHLARELIGHDVRTVQQQGLAGLENGELLRHAADEGFELFLTADQNLEFQQNLAWARLGVVASACWRRLVPMESVALPAAPERVSDLQKLAVSAGRTLEWLLL